MAGQLAFPFGVKSALGRDDFLVAPCNEAAFQFVQNWPNWPARAAALYGPQGCGKSHLAAIWQVAVHAQIVAARDIPAVASDCAAVIIEDVDLGTPDEIRDRALLALFERPLAWLLLTGRTPPREWPTSIGDLKSRFQSLVAFPMWAPDDALLAGLVAKHFADRQLDVPHAVVRRIVTHVERTPEAIGAFIARADRKALAEKRSVTERLVSELLDAEQKFRGGG